MGTRPGITLAAVGRLSGVGGSGITNSGTRTIRDLRNVRVFSSALRVRGLVIISLLFAPLLASAQDVIQHASAIAQGNSEQKREALFQIRNLRSEDASRAAVPALKDRDAIVRATAAASVVFLPKAEGVAVLTPLLDDRDPFVRKEAAYALGAVESPDAAPPLLRILPREKDFEARSAIVIALGHTGNVSAVEPLLGILRGRPSEETEFLRRAAARSVGQIAQILKTSEAYVVTPRNFLPEKDKPLTRDDMAAKFSVFNAAVPVLSAVLQNGSEADDTRREAAYALGEIGDESSRTVLEAHRNSPDLYLAEISREALLKIGGR